MADNNIEPAPSTPVSLVIVFLTWMFNGAAMLTRDNVSFMMGMLVSTLAVIHYVVAIRKNTKKE